MGTRDGCIRSKSGAFFCAVPRFLWYELWSCSELQALDAGGLDTVSEHLKICISTDLVHDHSKIA